ncbi:MAG: aquaporin [Paracoccaceae bacterium]
MTRALLAELIGTLFLVTCGIGTGIMATELAGGNVALALLANAIATGLVLYLLITIFAPLSGAHFNPAVTLFFLFGGELSPGRALAYLGAQLAGALLAVALTHLMFDLPLLQLARTERGGSPLWLSEAVAVFGLMMVIAGGQRHAVGQVPALVAAWIAAAYWFTGSTCFANPAVTLARVFTDSFTGIRYQDAPAFMLAQLAGMAIAALTLPRLFSK